MHSEQENNSFPAEFLERMKEMLGEEYPAFFEKINGNYTFNICETIILYYPF